MNFLTENFPLDTLHTFGFSVRAKYYTQFSTTEELNSIIDQCQERELEYKILGGGSNTVFTGDYKGVIIHPLASEIAVAERNTVIAMAGAQWDDIVAYSIEHGLQGLENLSFIPGTAGASPVQNIGAYGVEVGEKVAWVEYFDPKTRKTERINGSDCDFEYRQSIFKKELSHTIVTRVAYCLDAQRDAQYRIEYGDLSKEVQALGEINATNIRRTVIKIRSEKLPDPKVLGNAGSFFKNPVISDQHFDKLREQYPNIPSYRVTGGIKVPAGWLIDKAGLKGFRTGSVGVHEKQALVLVNYSGATAQDILALAQIIEKAIFDKYGIFIQKEVTVV